MLQIPWRVLSCLIAGTFVFAAGPPMKAGMITEALRGVAAKARMDRAKNNLVTLGCSLAIYKLKAGGYPTTEQGLKALVEKPAVAPIPRQWEQVMGNMLVDPWGHPYQYRFPSKKDPAKFEISSNGPDGVADTADDIRSDG